MNCITKPILLLHLCLLSVIVAINLTCDSVNPSVQSDVTCTCKNAPRTDIDWMTDDTFNSNCVLSSICAPQYSGYSYSMNTTANVYKMTKNSYNYSNCTKITCKDASDSSIMQTIIPSTTVFDTTFPTSMTEPVSNNRNGIISVTTGCISGFMDVQYDWYIIVNGVEEKYSVYDTSIIDMIDNSSCVNCGTDVNGQMTIGFDHSEASGLNTKTGLFKVSLYHVLTNSQLNLTSRYFYTVNISSFVTSVSWCNFSEDDSYCIILIAVMSVIIMIPCVIALAVVLFKRKMVKTRSAQDEEFRAVEIEKTSITVRWSRCDRNPSSKRVYILKNSNNEPIEITDSGEMTFLHTFSNLQDSTIYYIILHCADKDDINTIYKIYKPLAVRTKGVPEAPSNFRVEQNDVTESSMRVRWKPGDNGGSRQTFVLTCWPINGKIEIKDNGEDDLSFQLENLSEGTNYDLTLYAKNSEGSISRIQSLEKRTLAGIPDPPTEFRIVEDSVTETSIKVKWEPGYDGGCKQTFYVIINNKEYEVKETDAYTCESLKPNTYYDIALKAKNKKGEVYARPLRHIQTVGRHSV